MSDWLRLENDRLRSEVRRLSRENVRLREGLDHALRIVGEVRQINPDALKNALDVIEFGNALNRTGE